jgi:adenosylhomocysteine nucleosidase
MSKERVRGIMGALNEEIDAILPYIQGVQMVLRGSREYFLGELNGHRVVVTRSRIGKVAAATTATTLIDHFGIQELIFTGVAGGMASHVMRGDIVVADTLMQHDMDASLLPGFEKFEIPLLGKRFFQVEASLLQRTLTAAERSMKRIGTGHAVHQGIIASGDQFIACPEKRATLLKEIPLLLAVEMEGGAVAQVCHEWSIPCAVVRAISDSANEEAAGDFTRFIQEVAAPLSANIILDILAHE